MLSRKPSRNFKLKKIFQLCRKLIDFLCIPAFEPVFEQFGNSYKDIFLVIIERECRNYSVQNRYYYFFDEELNFQKENINLVKFSLKI
jgi:hypothetical protein